ncbi:MAG: AMP-binding protein [Chloroflexi bacterium]|nr:AMP-binding protein [Chloroflexota bacterium]
MKPVRYTSAMIERWGKRGLAGWFRTGDAGQFDKDGNIRVLGRIKDVLTCRGSPVYPAEVENALLSHPALQSAAVVGLAAGNGQVCVAFAVLKPGDRLSYEQMIDYLRSQGLAEYKMPSRLEIRESFPMTGDGLKISKKDLLIPPAVINHE